MDLVDLLLRSHGALRGSLKSLTGMLGQPGGVGWEDRVALDQGDFSRGLQEFIEAFKAHEAVEDVFLSRVVRQLGMDSQLDEAIAEGHRSLEAMTHLFEAIVGSFDGEHVYRVRMVLGHLNEELEKHLAYEETQIFPKLRDRLPPGLLRELGHRAVVRQRARNLSTGRPARTARPRTRSSIT
ncbi:MAG: hemerythrin domain-containing protein [Elusimicrobiota bacterium]